METYTNPITNKSTGQTFCNDKTGDGITTREKVHYLGDLRIVGQVVNNMSDTVPIGYVVMTEKTQKFKMYTVQQTMALLNKFKFVNAELSNGKVVNTECAMSRMPKFNTNMQVIGNHGIIILGEITDGTSSIGYRAMDTNAQIVDISESELIKLTSGNTDLLINAKIVNKSSIGRPIISAIKTEFTKIEKSKIPNIKIKTTSDWHKKMHVTKMRCNLECSCRALFGGTGGAFNTLWYRKRNVKINEYNSSVSYFDVNDEIRVILKEVYTPENNINITDRGKELLKKIVSEIPHSDFIGTDVDGKYHRSTNDDSQFILALSQFILYDDSIYDCMVNIAKGNIRLRNDKSAYYFRSKNLQQLIQSGYACERTLKISSIIKDTINERNIELEKRKKGRYGHFTTSTFCKAEDIAQLGFATVKQNDGYVYNTLAGYKKKLLFIGKDMNEDDYNKYMKKSRCLGDIISICYINKLLNKCDEQIKSNLMNTGTRYLPLNDMKYIIEMIISIAYMYESQAMKDYVADISSRLNDLSIEVPDYEELADTDYKLSPELKMYYASGFNVFLNDKDNYNYRPAYKRESKILNYRQSSPYHVIKHDMIQGEFASIVNMITPYNCDAETVEAYIGKLRFL